VWSGPQNTSGAESQYPLGPVVLFFRGGKRPPIPEGSGGGGVWGVLWGGGGGGGGGWGGGGWGWGGGGGGWGPVRQVGRKSVSNHGESGRGARDYRDGVEGVRSLHAHPKGGWREKKKATSLKRIDRDS